MFKEDIPWPLNKIEFEQYERINTFRMELYNKHMTGMFIDKNNFAKQVTASVYKLALEYGHIPTIIAIIPQFDLQKVLQRIVSPLPCSCPGRLDAPTKRRIPVNQLRSILVEQSVRENPAPVELPKEIWQKLFQEKEIYPDDLPDGIMLNDVRKASERYYEKPTLLSYGCFGW